MMSLFTHPHVMQRKITEDIPKDASVLLVYPVKINRPSVVWTFAFVFRFPTEESYLDFFFLSFFSHDPKYKDPFQRVLLKEQWLRNKMSVIIY